MDPKKFSPGEAIDAMLRQRGISSVSLIVPLLHANPDHHEDWDRIDRSINEALSVLGTLNHPPCEYIRNALSGISPLISFNRNNKGLGIYVSEDFLFLVFFPFTVHRSVTVAGYFQMKELFRLIQFSGDTMLLSISFKRARLFQVFGQSLREMQDANFPVMAENGFEYDHPSRSTSYAGSAHVKNFEKDKSMVRKRKFREFIHKIDNVLDGYLAKGREFIINGTATHISDFRSISKHNAVFTSDLTGGYDWYDSNDYNALLWPLMQERMGEKLIDVLENYNRRAGEGLVEHGMTQVWNAVREGRVDVLLVENDFETEGFINKDGALIFHSGTRPDGAHDYYPLAINELTQLAALQHAKIIFLDKDLMPGDMRVAAVCRY